jgi:hypothetical protein
VYQINRQGENVMNVSLRLFAAAALLGAIGFSTNASAQTGTIINAPFYAIEANVVGLWTRPADAAGVTSYAVTLSESVGVSCLTGLSTTNGNQKTAVIHSNRADYKAVRENLQLAYSLKKRVRIFTVSCINLQAETNEYIYPIIWAIDVFD